MNQRCETDSNTNTETLEQMKSTSQPRRSRPKTKRQAPTKLKVVSRRRLNCLPATEEGITTVIIPTTIQAVCRIKQVIFAPFITNDYLPEMIRKNHSAKQFSLIYTQSWHNIMAPKSFVFDLILTPLNQYPVLSGVRDVTSSRLSHEQTQSNWVCCFPIL